MFTGCLFSISQPVTDAATTENENQHAATTQTTMKKG